MLANDMKQSLTEKMNWSQIDYTGTVKFDRICFTIERKAPESIEHSIVSEVHDRTQTKLR